MPRIADQLRSSRPQYCLISRRSSSMYVNWRERHSYGLGGSDARGVDALIGVGWGESSPTRKGYRNGSYTRDLVPPLVGSKMKVPRDREGQFHTQIFERYRRYEPQVARRADTKMFVAGNQHRQGRRSGPDAPRVLLPVPAAISLPNQDPPPENLKPGVTASLQATLAHPVPGMGVHFSISVREKGRFYHHFNRFRRRSRQATKRCYHCGPVLRRTRMDGRASCKTYVFTSTPSQMLCNDEL